MFIVICWKQETDKPTTYLWMYDHTWIYFCYLLHIEFVYILFLLEMFKWAQLFSFSAERKKTARDKFNCLSHTHTYVNGALYNCVGTGTCNRTWVNIKLVKSVVFPLLKKMYIQYNRKKKQFGWMELHNWWVWKIAITTAIVINVIYDT